MLRASLQLVSVLAIAVVAASCGGDERAEYQRDLLEVGQVVADALEALPDGEASSIEQADIRRLGGQLRDAAETVDDLDARPGIEDAQLRLARGLRGVGESFELLADQLDDAETDAEKAERFVAFATDERVDDAFEDLIGAQEAFADKGFRVFPRGTVVTPTPAKQ